MRLTLRTLLAYLDDILDPGDKDELTKKIESSDFAEELIHRTRDTTRRLRLSAPQVVGTGMGLDPNTVAEYLDNVLPPDSVGDFERICLESDMHLAEVASCHHVLTMVLGEPAEVDPVARQRMYGIATEPAKRASASAPPAASAAAASRRAGAIEPVAMSDSSRAIDQSMIMEVPDYLRATGWSRARIAMLAIAAALLVGATIFLLPTLRAWFGDRPEQVDVAKGNGAADEPATSGMAPSFEQGAKGPDIEPQPRTNVRDQGNNTPSAGSGNATTPLPAIPEQVVPPASPGPARTTDPGIPTDPGTAELPRVVPQPPGFPQTPTGSTQPMEPNRNVGFPDFRTSVPPVPTTMGTGDATVPTPPAMPVPIPPPSGTTDVGVDPARAVVTPADRGIGTYVGGKTVLLRYRADQRAWYRVPPRATLVAGERLLALPEFRPTVALASGVSMDVSGGSLVTIGTADALRADGLPSGDAKTPALEVVYGRVVLVNTADDERPVRLAIGETVADVRLARGAKLAIEAQRSYVPGRDPRQAPSPLTVQVFAPAGGIVWVDKSGERPVDQPAQWSIADNAMSEAAALPTPPEWIDHEPTLRLSELRAATPVELALTTDRPVSDQLLELFQGARQREVKSLALRCSVHVGQFVPFIEALRDSDQRPYWKSQIDLLRASMALSPESAVHVWQTLGEQREGRAPADLFEMLCGYDRDQIGRTRDQIKSPTGALARLINWLASDLDYRVLAEHNLEEITGKALMRNPAGSPTERAQGIRDWQRRFEAGELVVPLDQ